MIYRVEKERCQDFEISSRLEWILPNGIGGYSMGSVSGSNQRRYHGHLVASNDNLERTVLLSNIEAHAETFGPRIDLSTNQYVGAIYPSGFQNLAEFSVGEFAEWRFEHEFACVTKRLQPVHEENQIIVGYENSGLSAIRLVLKPLVCVKPYHANFRENAAFPQKIEFADDRTVIEHGGFRLELHHPAARRIPAQGWYYRFEYRREVERGLDPHDDLYCPCELAYELMPGESVLIAAGLTSATVPESFDWFAGSEEATVRSQLHQSSRLFELETGRRRSIVAGFPWFTDWGRDTMISLPGIMLATGQNEPAKQVLADYANQLYQGLIPNRFVEGGGKPEYNTVDATLWFGNAIYELLKTEWDEAFARQSLSWLAEIIQWHQCGTLYNIKVDEADGLLSQGDEKIQLTWMDAKIGDWVVTPRYGKPVEVNALWINLLEVARWIGKKLLCDDGELDAPIKLARESFAQKFWSPTLGYYLDTVEPDDASLRPNQLIAMSLPFPCATGGDAKRALSQIRATLLTPRGLRTLAPSDSKYRGRFRGKMYDLDSSYHQGTVWPWLLGPYCGAIFNLEDDRSEIEAILKEVPEMLQQQGLGGIAEVYDGDLPQRAGGCPWQAWSVAELSRIAHLMDQAKTASA